MRRILVDHARERKALKRGGGRRAELADDALPAPEPGTDLDALDEALARLAAVQPAVAELVQLRYFGGLTVPAAADLLGISPRTADGWWAYARGWLATELGRP
jgi:RNA polymerase sigma factor (TIGR02999 family)